MTITLNGRDVEIGFGTTVQALLDDRIGSTRGSAVAVDGHVVPRARWGHTTLGAGATVEIVTAVQGG